MRFPAIKQLYQMNCGPTCLQIILKYYGIDYNVNVLNEYFSISRNGVSLLDIGLVAEKFGLRTRGVRLTIRQLSESKLPSIIFWKQQHFIVIYKITKNKVFVSDPAPGILLSYSIQEFEESWLSKETSTGYALILQTGIKTKRSKSVTIKKDFEFFLKRYFSPYKSYFVLAAIGMVIGLGLSILTPYLTKAVVDVGIAGKDLNFINLILLGQLMIAVSSILLNTLRSWLFLHLGARMNIAVISEFLIKIMALPISLFDSSQAGDLLQRINDHNTIKSFVSASTMNIIFSFFNLLVFGAILCSYNITIFFIFILFSVAYLLWVIQFMRKRKEFDYKLFEKNASNQNKLLEIFSGIRDIKLANLETRKEQEWMAIQVSGFQINVKQMTLSQYQQIGAFIIDTIKNIIISFITARLVVEGKMTLGMLLSVQYIIGQLSVPINQIIGFSNAFQDAKIAMDRIKTIYDIPNEQNEEQPNKQPDGSINFDNVSFSYPGGNNLMAINNVTITIPKNKITAIVGSSGSGKSTILKVLLKFYNPQLGKVTVGSDDFNDIGTKCWRDKCASVLQDGYIFTDTVFHNIAFGSDELDAERVIAVARLSNIHDHVMTLTDGYQTIIGTEINSLSQGQRQRLLIARALYKDSEYVFLDEPTSSLDIYNENVVMNNIFNKLQNKTVVIIAHKLRTIQNADQIIVMENGKVVEVGTHQELSTANGLYKNLLNISK